MRLKPRPDSRPIQIGRRRDRPKFGFEHGDGFAQDSWDELEVQGRACGFMMVSGFAEAQRIGQVDR
jgi:hypothetical protein